MQSSQIISLWRARAQTHENHRTHREQQNPLPQSQLKPSLLHGVGHYLRGLEWVHINKFWFMFAFTKCLSSGACRWYRRKHLDASTTAHEPVFLLELFSSSSERRILAWYISSEQPGRPFRDARQQVRQSQRAAKEKQKEGRLSFSSTF